MSVNTCMSLAQIVGKKTLSSVRYGACTKINVRHNQFTLQEKNILCFLCYFSFHLLTLDHFTTCLSVLYHQWLTLKKKKRGSGTPFFYYLFKLSAVQAKPGWMQWMVEEETVSKNFYISLIPSPSMVAYACLLCFLA